MLKVVRKYKEIDPEDIFLDSANIPGLDQERFEGRMEKPIGEATFWGMKIVLFLIVLGLGGRLFGLEIMNGSDYASVSLQNSLRRTPIFADRGLIHDRNGLILASNEIKEASTTDFALRYYAAIEGVTPVVGYVKYPKMDSKGNYYDHAYHGEAGIEKSYNDELTGVNGSKLTETDAHGHVSSESAVNLSETGHNVTLTIDAKLTEDLYQNIKSLARDKGFSGGGAVIMDVETGEILALTSYPEYDANVVTAGSDSQEINRLLNDPSTPFLNRVVSGLYTPGSIVKPVVAIGVLNEHIIDPMKKILSTGSISVPNPYDPKHPSVFKDWREQGWITMRDALSVSSDVYFYVVGGGFQGQPGLGVINLDKYFEMFGMTTETGIDLPAENTGYIASPVWKAANFPDDPAWRLGDTYHTAIGQYGTQVTPLEAVRWVSSIANGGRLIVPQVVYTGTPKSTGNVDISKDYFQIVREGMRQSVAGGGVATSLNSPAVKVAGKTGTAELGSKKQFVNSWVTGFFPYDKPHYAFAVIMERGPVTNLVGAPYVMRQTLDWMALNTPEYLQ